MTLTIKIDMDNAAFEDPDEVHRILKKIRVDVSDPQWSQKLRDINGNTVGNAELQD